MTARFSFLIALAVLAAPSGALAAPGDLDPTYGAGGIATATASSDTSSTVGLPAAIDVAADGDTLAITTGTDGDDLIAIVTRNSALGAPDTGFSSDGRYEVAVGDGDTIPIGLAEQADGRIVLGLVTRVGRRAALTLVRLTAVGAYDSAYGGGDGIVTVVVPGLQAYGLTPISPGIGVVGPVIGSDGRISIVGWTRQPSLGSSAIELVHVATMADGAALPGFVDGSRRTLRTVGFTPTALAADGTGVVVAGPPRDFASGAQAVRLDGSGALDVTFGTLGQQTLTGFGGGGRAVRLSPSLGGLLVAGSDGANWLVRRMTPTGATDPAFNGGTTSFPVANAAFLDIGIGGAPTPTIIIGGTLGGNRVLRKLDLATGAPIAFAGTIEATGFVAASALAVGGAQVLIGGRPASPSRDGGVVAFRTSSGVLDGTYAPVVIGTGTAPMPVAIATAATFAPTGALRSGSFITSLGQGLVALRGFDAAGTLVTGGDQVFHPSQNSVTGVAVDATGRLLVGGRTTSPVGVFVARALPDGTPDPALTPVSIATPAFAQVTAILPGADGFIVAVGGALGGNVLCRLLRYGNDGAPDPGFGLGGSVDLDVVCGAVRRVGSGFVVASARQTGPDVVMEIRRYDVAGDPVAAFSGDGLMTVPLGQDGSQVHAVVERPGDRLAALVGRVPVFGGGRSIVVAAIRADGTLDPAFGTGGLAPVSDAPPPVFPVGQLASSSDGRLVVGLTSLTGGDDELELFRVSAAGAVQPLATGARAIVLGQNAAIKAIEVLGDGRIMVAANGDRRLRGLRVLSDRPGVAARLFDRRGRRSIRVANRVTPHGGRTTWWVEYGLTKAYGRRTKKLVINGASARTVRVLLRHLRAGTRYHYRLVAENGSGRTRGTDRTFRTRR